MMVGLYLIAHIAGRTLAVDAERVHSVVDVPEIIPVPRAESEIRGIMALRSRIVTVIDTGLALGMEATEAATRAIIVRVDGHDYALLVDALDDIATFELEALANGIGLNPQWLSIARGTVTRDEEPILVVDLSALIPGLGLAA